tara:strand:- start:16665 stop:16952 length:288 start_codon:yes stop_codon:yes gene_type:complete
MRSATEEDLREIAEELNYIYGFTKDAHEEYFCEDSLHNVVVLKGYMPDSPSWAGDIALVVHGVSCCKDILYKINDKWTWVESMNEGEYEHNKELI